MSPVAPASAGHPAGPAAGSKLPSLEVIFRVAATLVSAVVLAGALVAAGGGTISAATTGSPDRGRAVFFGPGGCSGCHSVELGPERALDRPAPHPRVSSCSCRRRGQAARCLRRRVDPRARRLCDARLRQRHDAATERADAAPDRGPRVLPDRDAVHEPRRALPLPAKPIAACDAKASCRALVARWATAETAPRGGAPRRQDRRRRGLPLVPPLCGERRQERLRAGADEGGARATGGCRTRQATALPAVRQAGIGDAGVRRLRRCESEATRRVPPRLSRRPALSTTRGERATETPKERHSRSFGSPRGGQETLSWRLPPPALRSSSQPRPPGPRRQGRGSRGS